MSKQTDLINVTDAITVSGSNVGIGTSSPEGKLHVYSDNVGTPSADADDFIIEKAGDTGLSILSTTTGRIYFGDASSNDQGSIRYVHSDNSMRFETDSAERMRIDSSGQLIIKTAGGALQWNNGYQTITGDAVANDLTYRTYQNHIFKNTTGSSSTTDGTEVMRIDSSGNVLVGTTDNNVADNSGISNSGFNVRSSGRVLIAEPDNAGLWVNRLGNDGDIAVFRKDGSTVGSIGSVSGDLYLNTGSTGLRFFDQFSQVIPCGANGSSIDNAIDLGRINVRFDDVYATNGSIQTSDRNEKQDIASLTATEMLVAARISGLFKTFRWIDSVADKGDNARTHTGVIAQDVQAAFTAEGLDAGDYALFTSATWWETQTDVAAVEADEDNDIEASDAYTRTDTYDTLDEAPDGATERTRMGIRYPELLAFVGAYNEQRFASIETRLAALEAV
jgi:hypothetical protein